MYISSIDAYHQVSIIHLRSSRLVPCRDITIDLRGAMRVKSSVCSRVCRTRQSSDLSGLLLLELAEVPHASPDASLDGPALGWDGRHTLALLFVEAWEVRLTVGHRHITDLRTLVSGRRRAVGSRTTADGTVDAKGGVS